ncbi:exodeoxyribonuclease VII large subunit [Marichromatium bheemlicum]|uniref:Exodeoxyribonuclease 7 large subunit n=1 Tax=Marichromatium bheemlicum TaxID=365339 RepID=A0ABX1I414_9GAMM|nr:exodeoxyribonuclease VII large subunit [Marichromatium bheemlicum]NKN31908.1 exodeoxyribonuclease VII large subunit [Marichromatium bheemlicum]
MRAVFDPEIYTVSRLNREVRAVLDGAFPVLRVRGEVSNLAAPASGHLYFTLRDAGAAVRCALFRARARTGAMRPTNGQQVVVRARVGLYEPRGDFQLIVESVEADGAGAARLAFEQLAARLEAEGLCAPERKRAPPAFPRQVGLITSPSGAALHDLLVVLRRRQPGLAVLIYPAQVQGEDAAASLVAALARANARAECDVLILARGGGAREDLEAFNDETLARAVAASSIPVVTGVGHETDLSIADLVADRRAPTPSAAAELVAPAREPLLAQLDRFEGRLALALRQRIEAERQRVQGLERGLRLLHPRARLEQRAQHLDRLETRLAAALAARLQRETQRLDALANRLGRCHPGQRLAPAWLRLQGVERRLRQAEAALLERRRARLARAVAGLDARGPLATLARGYAVVTYPPGGAPVRDPAVLAPGARVGVRVHGGAFIARVEASDEDD